MVAKIGYGHASVRAIEKLCKTDIRFMWLLQDESAPSYMTIDNFMNETLLGNLNSVHGTLLRMNRSIQAREQLVQLSRTKPIKEYTEEGLKV